MGRARIQIDKTQFENLCKLQCTLSEISGWFNCSEDTIERWCKRTYNMPFNSIFSIKREAGRISLRRTQFRLAESHPNMAIWLGKQYLGQSDDPRRNVREETTEDKLDRLLDSLTAAISAPDDDFEDDIKDGEEDEQQ